MENFIRSVARFIDNGFFKKRWGTHLDMNIRYFNIVVFLLSFSTALFSIFIGIHRKTYEVPLVLLIASVFFLLIYFLGNKTKRYNFYMILSTYAFNLVFLPVLYFVGGGIDYGTWLYFIAGLMLTVLFIHGPAFIVSIIIQPLYYFAIFLIHYFYPNFNPFGSSEAFNMNVFWSSPRNAVIINFAIISISIGMLIKSLFVSYIDEREAALLIVKDLEELSLKDPLTGTFNRRYLFKHLDESIKAAQNEHIPLSVVMYDIDNFKQLNDTYGHIVGDEVLCAVSKKLVENCREYDVVARYGGEEFLIVFPGAKDRVAYLRADKIRKDIESSQLSPSVKETITISGGLACYEPGLSASKLIDIADTNMYIAKEAGRNRIAWKNGALPPLKRQSDDDTDNSSKKYGRRETDNN